MIVSVILLVFAGLMLGGSLAIYFYIRRLYREQKNYERGLKMVPLLIHLPPQSDDTEAGGRDVRDLVDENISKAQILYGILASTYQKGFASRFFGQRHISLEIVASRGFVHFYTAVPVPLLNIVEQAIVSAYPAARLEEVAEHNIFNPVGRLSGTLGGELVLKEDHAYPIATYQDLKRDSMQAILNALSKLDKEDGAGIQILLRPTGGDWRKRAAAEADKKRTGKSPSSGFEKALAGVGQVITALNKPPEDKSTEAKPGDDKTPSNLEQSVIAAIEEKTKHPGYEVLIRLIASSNLTQRSQAILNSMVASFSLFDAPGRNGFKFVPARDIDDFVTAYIMRFFPQDKNQNVLNSVEIASMFHFPDQANIPTSQLERQSSKQVDGPRNMPEEGLLLGYNVFRGAKKAIRLGLNDRARHLYVVGQTGTGKSTFLENLALQDMLEGRGFAFIDPHGDTAERLLAMVPRERTEDVVYFCPADMDYPMGLNMFEFHSPEQKDFLIQEAINMLYKLYDPQHQGIIGPRYEHWFRNAALTLMADPNGSTFIDIPNVFQDNRYMRQKLQYVTDQTVLDFWNKEMAQTSDYHKSEVLGWFVSKFGAFRSNEMMRNIIGQTKSSFNLRQIMDEAKILLVNLSKGRSGELNSKLLGMVFVTKFQAAAMSRAAVPETERRDFCLYVDEFQNFSTDSFADILSEARKYHLNLVVANQFITQLTEQIRDAVFGNVGTIAAMRVGTADAEALAKIFQPTFDLDDLQRLPNFNSIVRMLIGGVPTQTFSMSNLPQLGTPNPQLAAALKQLSAAKFGRPRAVVEDEIFKRLSSPAPPPMGAPGELGTSPWSNLPPARSTAGLPGATPAANKPAASSGLPTPQASSSFLDEWLAKRKAQTAVGPAMGLNRPAPAPAGPRPPATVASTNPARSPGLAADAPPSGQTMGVNDAKSGELKINRDPGAGNQDTHVLHIDREGNLSYD